MQRLVLQRCQQGLHGGQLLEGVAQTAQIPWASRAQRQPRQNPLHVANLSQQRGQFRHQLLLDELGNHLLTIEQLWPIARRLMDPAFEQAAAHRRGGGIEHLGQGVFHTAGQILCQLQIPAGGGIQHYHLLGLLQTNGADMGQGGALGVLDVLHQATGGTQGGGGRLDAKADQIAGAELLTEQMMGGGKLELPLGAAAQPLARAEQRQVREGFRIEQFGGIQPLQLGQESLFGWKLVDAETTGADIQHR